MTWIKDRLFALKNIAILVGSFIVFIFIALGVAFKRGRQVGEAIESAENDLRKVREAAAAGDDDGVYREWRRRRK